MTLKEAEKYWNEELSESIREEISLMYDDKSIKLDEIVIKYNLPFDKAKLPALVLPRKTDAVCKWCGNWLYIKRRRSTSIYATNPEYCICCGHVNTDSCRCLKCVEMRARQKEQERAEEVRRQEEKKRRIINEYRYKTSPVEFNTLSILDKINIGIILSHTVGKTEFALEDNDTQMYPAEADISILIHMLQQSILIISENVNPDAFTDDLEICKFAQLKLKINVDIDDADIDRLLDGRINLSGKDFRILWQYIAGLQLMEYLIHEMHRYNLVFSPGKTTTSSTLLHLQSAYRYLNQSAPISYSNPTPLHVLNQP